MWGRGTARRLVLTHPAIVDVLDEECFGETLNDLRETQTNVTRSELMLLHLQLEVIAQLFHVNRFQRLSRVFTLLLWRRQLLFTLR